MPTRQRYCAAPTKKMTVIKPPAIHAQYSYSVVTTKNTAQSPLTIFSDFNFHFVRDPLSPPFLQSPRG